MIAGQPGRRASPACSRSSRANFVGTNPSQTVEPRQPRQRRRDRPERYGRTGVLGGLGPGERNVIAHNGGGGIFGDPAGFLMPGATGQITARGNLFYDNRPVAIAPWPRSAAPGGSGRRRRRAQRRQNAPVITGIDYGPPTVAHAVLSSTPSTTSPSTSTRARAASRFPALPRRARSSSARSPSRPTPRVSPRSTSPCPRRSRPGDAVSAIATDPLGNTSEFAQTILLSRRPGRAPPAAAAAVTLFGQLLAGRRDGRGRRGPAPSNVVVTPPYTITANMPAFAAGSVHDDPRHQPWRNLGNAAQRLHRRLPRRAAGQPVPRRRRQARREPGDGGRGRRLLRHRPAVKRQSMAVFVLKAEHGICYTPPALHASGRLYRRRPALRGLADWIEAMAAEGHHGRLRRRRLLPARHRARGTRWLRF